MQQTTDSDSAKAVASRIQGLCQQCGHTPAFRRHAESRICVLREREMEENDAGKGVCSRNGDFCTPIPWHATGTAWCLTSRVVVRLE